MKKPKTRFRIRLDFEIEVPGDDQPLPQWAGIPAIKLGLQSVLQSTTYEKVEFLPGCLVNISVVDSRRVRKGRRQR